MKFWELSSVMGSEQDVLEACLRKPQWVGYYDWYVNLDKIVNAQDREKLDAKMPNALVRDILLRSTQTFFLHGGRLRSRPFTDEDVKLSAVEAFDRFGGTALEETLERGSATV